MIDKYTRKISGSGMESVSRRGERDASVMRREKGGESLAFS